MSDNPILHKSYIKARQYAEKFVETEVFQNEDPKTKALYAHLIELGYVKGSVDFFTALTPAKIRRKLKTKKRRSI